MPSPSGDKPSDETFYPTLFLEWEKPYNFPEEGTMTVRFKKTSEENRKRGEDMTQRVNLDILEILDTKATKGGDEGEEESTGDVLDREVKKAERKKKRAARATERANEADAEVDDEESY